MSTRSLRHPRNVRFMYFHTGVGLGRFLAKRLAKISKVFSRLIAFTFLHFAPLVLMLSRFFTKFFVATWIQFYC